MKVKATRMGFYQNQRRRQGDVFVISDDKFTAKDAEKGKCDKSVVGNTKELGDWMVQVEESVPVVKPSFSSKKGKRFQRDEEDDIF